MGAPKGQPRPPGAGRKAGTPNKATASIKGAFVEAFDKLGGADALARWAVDQPTEFYKLASKLIPTELAGGLQHSGELVVRWAKDDTSDT